jgi:hypothetical protein
LLDPLANPSEKSVVGHSVSHSRSLRGIGSVSNGDARTAMLNLRAEDYQSSPTNRQSRIPQEIPQIISWITTQRH